MEKRRGEGGRERGREREKERRRERGREGGGWERGREGEATHPAWLNLSGEVEHLVFLHLPGEQVRRLQTRCHPPYLPLPLLVPALHHKHVLLRELCHPLLHVVTETHHGTSPDDAPHGVGVLDATHEQLSLQEETSRRVGHLLWVHEPRPVEPGVPAEREAREHGGQGGNY